MNFVPVERKDYGFLYELLEQRPKAENITHKEMPTYPEHCAFLDSKPYSEHYIIEKNGERVGSLYIRDNKFVGIHTLDKSEERVVRLLKDRPNIQFEVSPKNRRFQRILKRNGYKLLHETYA